MFDQLEEFLSDEIWAGIPLEDENKTSVMGARAGRKN
jgi:hypothetical protein